jgi:hypothetical protein
MFNIRYDSSVVNRPLPRIWLFIAAFSFLFFLILYIYSFSLNGPFIWDDYYLVRNNTEIRDPGNLGKIFTKPWSAVDGANYLFYRPLSTVFFILDYQLYGLNPGGYHVTNVLFHCCVVLALFWVVCFFIGARGAYLAALFYAVFPANVETVAYISNSAEILSCLFSLLSLGAYFRFDANGKKWWLLGFVVFFAVALLAKETVLLIVVIIAFYHFCFKSRPRLVVIVTIFSMVMVYFLWRSHIFSGKSLYFSLLGPFRDSFRERLILFGGAFFEYLRTFIWPMGLHVEYMDWASRFWDYRVLIGLLSAMTILFFVIRYRYKNSLLSFFLGWYFLAIVPFSGIYPLPFYRADHYMYFPAIGLFAAAGYFMATFNGYRICRVAVAITVGVFLLFYSIISIKLNKYWSDEVEFFRTTFNYSPHSERIAILLGYAYLHRGDYKKAKEFMTIFSTLNPSAKNAKDTAACFSTLKTDGE